VFGQAFEAFCIWSGKTPAELLEMRRQDLKDPNDGYRTLELVQNFILHGEYPDKRRGREGQIVKLSESGRARRENYLSAIKSYFTHNRAELQEDRSFKIRDTDNVPHNESFMELNTARAIIGALKEPYKTLATAALYSGMGRKEALSLNRVWQNQIVPQLQAGKDPVRIDFAKRKSNDRPYFTFLPSSLLRPFIGKDTPFEIYTKHSKTNKVLRPVNESDLQIAWSYAKKRAGIKGKQTFHQLRDLLVTSFYRVGADIITAQFLTGHGVDPNNYLQITKSPERPEREWQKYRQFLDSGSTSESQEQLESLRRGYQAMKDENEQHKAEIKRIKADLEKMRDEAHGATREAIMRELAKIPMLGVLMNYQGTLSQRPKQTRKARRKSAKGAKIKPVDKREFEASMKKLAEAMFPEEKSG